MVLLEEIPTFPTPLRQVLEREYGITSAEAFYEHAARHPAGMQSALQVTPAALEGLQQQVEGHLPPQFVARCQRPREHHPRGALLP